MSLTEEAKLVLRNLPHLNTRRELGGFPFYKWMRKYYQSAAGINLLTSANQVGKDVWCETDIPTPNGFKRMKNLKIGDEVFARDGSVCRVIDIPWDNYNDTYKIHFNDGTSVIAGPNHEWICKGYNERFRGDGKWIVAETREIIEKGNYAPDTTAPKRFSIPITDGVDFKEDYLFDPYLIGLLIGDGCLINGKVALTSGDREVRDYCVEKYNAGLNGVICNIRGIGHIISHFKLDCKSEFKKIPWQYMRGSRHQRLELLRGLMDSDGTAQKNGVCLYYTVSEKLKDTVIELVHSLGGWASYTVKNKSEIGNFNSFNIRIKINESIFKLPRKLERQKWTERYSHERVIVKIEKWKRLKTKCITVDSADSSFLCTRNYIVTHNSSINIRKMINWATNTDIWPKLWPNNHHNVAQFWYLYPTLDVATIEFQKKWEPEWMPRGDMKDHPVYGWKAEYERKKIKAIHFNTGVTCYFKSYAQNAADLQSGSCHAIFCDEELPISIFDELKFRTSATDGQFHMVFTATLGQYEWECAMEKVGEPEELFKRDSCKIQVSLYDCLEYEDGTKTPWTVERIQKRIDSCSSDAEVQKRIYGRFVQTGAFKYSQFLTEENLLDKWVFNEKYYIYSATDPGSGGKKGHPTGISFLAVSPDFTEGVIFMGWRGDGITTTQADALQQYIKIRGKLNVSTQYYDYHAKDFYTIAERKGEVFHQAEKSHEIGEPILKSLLKFNALKIVVGELIGVEEFNCDYNQGELLKLISEFRTLKDETDKRNAKDDLIDTVRYNVAKIPWNWQKIMNGGKKKVEQKHIPKTDAERIKERRGTLDSGLEDMNNDYEEEIGFWNEHYDC